MVEFYKDSYVTVYLGDSRAVLAELPEHSVDMVMTSPPYYGLRAYKCEPSIWGGDENCKHEFRDEKTTLLHENRNFQTGTQEEVQSEGRELTHVFKDSKILTGFCLKCHAWRGVLGMEPTPDLYIQHLVGIFDLARRVLKPTGVIFVDLGDSYSGGGPHHGDNNTGKHNKEGQRTGRDLINIGVPAKSLIGIPARFQLEMCNPNWVLREDLTQNEREYVIMELTKRGIL